MKQWGMPQRFISMEAAREGEKREKMKGVRVVADHQE
jgi:hypothetical protein